MYFDESKVRKKMIGKVSGSGKKQLSAGERLWGLWHVTVQYGACGILRRQKKSPVGRASSCAFG